WIGPTSPSVIQLISALFEARHAAVTSPPAGPLVTIWWTRWPKALSVAACARAKGAAPATWAAADAASSCRRLRRMAFLRILLDSDDRPLRRQLAAQQVGIELG